MENAENMDTGERCAGCGDEVVIVQTTLERVAVCAELTELGTGYDFDAGGNGWFVTAGPHHCTHFCPTLDQRLALVAALVKDDVALCDKERRDQLRGIHKRMRKRNAGSVRGENRGE